MGFLLNERRDVNSIWRFEEKVELVQIVLEEREKGRGFMQRMKERWGAMYPRRDSISKQNLRDHAVRFRKDPDVMQAITIARRQEGIQQEGAAEYADRVVNTQEGQQGKSVNWTAPMKVSLVEVDKEERQ